MSVRNAVRQRDEATMSSLSQQLPGRVAAERLLLREFSHRINNELASAISLVSVTASRCTSNEARAALAAVRDRLESFARVHHSLQMPEYTTTIDLAAYIHQLCRAISHSKLAGKGIELSLSIYPLSMSSERCWFLGMIVFELITNAARHAFHDKAGSIHLEIWPAGTSIECCIADNGTSDANPSPRRGLSIVAALTSSLRGTVDMQFGPNGTRTVVNFPHSA
jgi:two-component sensor histidine kinase